MRVLVCGGRDFTDARVIDQVLSGLEGLGCLIEGGAEGADTLART